MVIDYKDTSFTCDRSGRAVIHRVVLKSLRTKKLYSAGCNRPARTISPNVERRTAQCRTMMHQTKPESFRWRRVVRKSDSVIHDHKAKFWPIHCEPNINLLGSTVSDRVRHRLLCDSVKLVRNGRILDAN